MPRVWVPMAPQPLPVLATVLLAALIAVARSAYVTPDAYDVLYQASSIEEKIRQTSLLSELGSSVDGIKLLLTRGRTLGTGLQRLRPVPANLTTGPGLSFLATAVQAYIALYSGVSLIVPGIFYFWRSDTNAWYHAAATYTPGGVTDFSGGTLYSSAFYTLKDGPLLITTPTFTADNLWTINFYEIYGNSYHVVGAAYGDNNAASYFIVPPGWEGEVPDASYKLVRSPTVEGYLLGRTFVIPNAAAAVAFNLGWTIGVYGSSAPNLPYSVRFAYPETNPRVGNAENPEDPLVFWRTVGEVYRRNGAPYVVDPLARLLPSIGLWREYGFVQASVEPLALEALKIAPYYATRILTAKWLNIGQPEHNYWNAPWNLGYYGSDYVTNAATQKFFIIVNRARDALYYFLFVDSDGEPLNGTNDYVIEFPAAPPVVKNSFWSLVAGPAVSTSDRLAALPPASPNAAVALPTWANLAPDAYSRPDGSWPFRVSASVPPSNSSAPQRGWNFVQAPRTGFYLTLRLYAPQEAALRNAYVPPPVVRAVPPPPSPQQQPSSPPLASGTQPPEAVQSPQASPAPGGSQTPPVYPPPANTNQVPPSSQATQSAPSRHRHRRSR